MELYLDKRALKQIRLSASDAVEEGDSDTLKEDIIEAFSDEQIEEIERRIDNADFYDFLAEILDEWSGDDVDELLELLEAQLAEAGIDLKFQGAEPEEEEEEEEEEDAEPDDDADFGGLEDDGEDGDGDADGEEEAEEEA